MKLYYKPGACSLASHIALTEAGAAFEIEKVDTKAGRTESGEDFSTINPNGYVPALKLDNGDVITEGAAILQYIADTNIHAKLAPRAGTVERAKVQQHLNYVGSELHKAFAPFFGELDDEGRKKAEAKLDKRMDYIETLLADGREYLLNGVYSVADAYLFVVANWSNFIGVDLKKWPHIAAFVKRNAERPAAQTAMRAEGLLDA